MNPSIERVVSADGTEICLERRGSGPALVVVVGALSDRSNFTGLGELLEPQRTLITYDRRGRGDSGSWGERGYQVEREIEDLKAVVDAAYGPAFVFGHSSGAALSLKSALAGLPLQRLALYEPPFLFSARSSDQSAAFAGKLRRLVAEGDSGGAARLFLSSALGTSEAGIKRASEGPGWARLCALASSLADDVELVGDRRLPLEQLGSLIAPTLVLVGGDSQMAVREPARALADALDAGRLEILDGERHVPSEAPLAKALSEFASDG